VASGFVTRIDATARTLGHCTVPEDHFLGPFGFSLGRHRYERRVPIEQLLSSVAGDDDVQPRAGELVIYPLDDDEYIYAPWGLQMLARQMRQHGCCAFRMYWEMFDSVGHTRQSSKSVIYEYHRRSDLPNRLSKSFSFWNMSKCTFHTCKCKSKLMDNTCKHLGRVYKLAHYRAQSKDHHAERLSRGNLMPRLVPRLPNASSVYNETNIYGTLRSQRNPAEEYFMEHSLDSHLAAAQQKNARLFRCLKTLFS